MHRQIRLAALLAALCAVPALAQEVKAVRIEAQDMPSALRSLAGQTGIQLLFDADDFKGSRAAALSGTLSPEEALRRLLEGSGYGFKATGAGTYIIQRLPKANVPRADARLEEMVVTATRTERPIDEVPASVNVIDARDIATQQPRNLADLLRNVEGVDVAGYGSPASLPVIRMRGIGGSAGGQTSQILIDGMPIESPVAGIHQGLQALDLQDLERVEVVRGPASALYGPSAVGGVVNFLPKRWRGEPGAEVSVGVGSHNATSVSAAVGGAWDVVDFRLSGNDYRTDGYLARPNADPWGTKDLASRDGKESKFGLTVGLHPSANQEITFSARQADADSAWLGGHPNYRFHNDTEGYDLGYRFEAGNWGVFKARYRSTRQKTHILFDDEYVNSNAGSLILAEVDDRSEDNDYLDLQADLHLGSADLLTLGYAYGKGKDTSGWVDVIYGGSSVSVSESELTGLYVQDEHRFSEAFTLLAGGRWDHYKFFGDTINGVPTGKDSTDSVFNPRLGARYKLSNATSLYASVGTAYVPALNYLKFRSPAGLDNASLKPETSTSYEIGANHRVGSWSMRAALFHTDYRDKISSIFVGAKQQNQNIGKVAVDGLELAFEGTVGNWQPYVNYAYTNSRIKENPSDPLTVGKQIQRVSPNKLNIGATWAPTDRYYVRVSGRYTDDYYFNDRNTSVALNPGHFVADAKISWRPYAVAPYRDMEVSFAVSNLFDKKFSEQQYEYMDGLNVWLGLNAKF